MTARNIMEIITVHGWPRFFAQLRPGENPQSANGERLRGRVNEILFSYKAAWFAAKHKPEARDFAEYAEAGRLFLSGVRSAHATLNLSLGALSADPHRRSAAFVPDTNAVAAIEKQIALLDMLQEVLGGLGDAEDSGPAAGPASKPWLHDAVADLRLLWNDEGQASRPKKQFLDLVEALIGGAFGITASSILESHDRHCHRIVAERLAIREERRQWDASQEAIGADQAFKRLLR